MEPNGTGLAAWRLGRRTALGPGLVGLSAGLALSWLFGLPPSAGLRAGPSGTASASAAESGRLMAITAESPGNPGGGLLYLIDPRRQSFAIYRVDGLNGTVKLEAARQFGADLKLTEYKNMPPEVSAISAMVNNPSGSPAPRGAARE